MAKRTEGTVTKITFQDCQCFNCCKLSNKSKCTKHHLILNTQIICFKLIVTHKNNVSLDARTGVRSK